MNREIRAFYTENMIRVYQAYNKDIANEAIKMVHLGVDVSALLPEEQIYIVSDSTINYERTKH